MNDPRSAAAESPEQPGSAVEHPAERSLERKVSVGFRWSLVNNLVTRLGNVLIGLVLARILDPADYGVFAVALVVMNALLSMNELGVSLAVVRWPGNVRAIAPTVALISVTSSALLCVSCLLAAHGIASMMGVPSATGVIRLLALTVALDGLASVPNGLLTREFLQGRRFILDLANFGVGAALSVGLATMHLGAASLAWGRIGGNLTAVLLLACWMPSGFRLGWDRQQARALLSFGAPLALSSLLVFAMLNADYIIVGRLLGPVQLGLYLLAFNLSSWPVTVFSQAARRVALAGFSRLHNDPSSLWRAFSRSSGMLLVLTLPVCILLSVLSGPIIHVLYGSKWLPSAGALGFLAFLGGVRVITELAYDLLVALGRSRSTMWLQGSWLVVLVPALVLGTHFGGIRGTGIAHLAVAAGFVVPAFAMSLRRQGLPLTGVIRAWMRPALAGLVMAGVAIAVSRLDLSTMWRLLSTGGVALGVYVAIVLPARHALALGPDKSRVGGAVVESV